MPDESVDLDQLTEALKGGSEAALGTLFAHYRGALWRMVHFRLDPRLAQRVDADDVLQESYLAAVQRIDTFSGEMPTEAFVWLRLIAGQTMIDVHRRHLGAGMRNAAREVPLGQRAGPMATSASLSHHFVASLTSPSHAAMRAEAILAVEKALESMDPIDREVLLLRHFEELENNQVAAILGLQRSAASNRYVRALSRLKGLLGDLSRLGDDR